MIKMVVSGLLLCTLMACESEGSKNPNEILFGTFFGYCAGEGCIEIYRLDLVDEKLYEDTNDSYPASTDFYEGNFSKLLSKVQYEIAKELVQAIPPGLLAETATVIGQPDAGDWGGAYFEYNDGVLHRFWLLDLMDENMPQEYNEFVSVMREKMNLINP